MTAPGDKSLSVHTATGPVLVQIGSNAPGTKGLSIQTEAGRGIIPVHGIAPGDRVISMQTATGQVLVPVTATTPDVMGDICLAGSHHTTDGAKIYRSTDGGENWVTVYTDTSKTTAQIQTIRRRGSVALAGTNGAGGLLRSTDSGVTWGIIIPYTTTTYESGAWTGYMALEFISDSTVIMGVRDDNLVGTIKRSTDAGLTWTTVKTLPDYNYCSGLAYIGSGICVAGVSSGAHAGGLSKIYRSTNNGTTWSYVRDLTPTPYSSVVSSIDYVGKGTVFASTMGLWRSVDAGTTWEQVVSYSYPGPQILGVAHVGSGVCVAPSFATTTTIRSTDWGESWDDYTVEDFNAIKYMGGGVVLAGGDAGVFRSVDYGANYTQVLTSGNITTVAPKYP